jgi:hypothetical protein
VKVIFLLSEKKESTPGVKEAVTPQRFWLCCPPKVDMLLVVVVVSIVIAEAEGTFITGTPFTNTAFGD